MISVKFCGRLASFWSFEVFGLKGITELLGILEGAYEEVRSLARFNISI